MNKAENLNSNESNEGIQQIDEFLENQCSMKLL